MEAGVWQRRWEHESARFGQWFSEALKKEWRVVPKHPSVESLG